MRIIAHFFKDILTGIDGESYDWAKLGALASLAVFLFCTVYDLIENKRWDSTAYGLGVAAILGAAAWGVHVKAHTEPGEKTNE